MPKIDPQDTSNPNPAVAVASPAAPVAAPTPNLTAGALQAENVWFARRLAADDAARAKAATVTMIAIAGFTLVDDDHLEGVVVRAGEEFDVSAFDEARFTGRARRKSLDAFPGTAGNPPGSIVQTS